VLTGRFENMERKSRVEDFFGGLIIIGILVSMISPSSSTGIGSGFGRLVTSVGSSNSFIRSSEEIFWSLPDADDVMLHTVFKGVFPLSSVLIGD